MNLAGLHFGSITASDLASIQRGTRIKDKHQGNKIYIAQGPAQETPNDYPTKKVTYAVPVVREGTNQSSELTITHYFETDPIRDIIADNDPRFDIVG